MDIESSIKFIREIDRLKSILRKTYNYHEKRYENSAEHSWHLANAVIVFKDYADHEINLERCLKMALIHDIVEIEAGDNIVYQEDPSKFERELDACHKLFGILGEKEKSDYIDLWISFEKKQCADSRFVGALDRFLPLYSNVLNEGHSWKTHKIDFEFVYNFNSGPIQAGSKALWDYTHQLLVECRDKGFFYSK